MFIDIKYLNLLSTRLPLFKKKSDTLWNFRCPICGDSEKNKTKARGFVFQTKNSLVYKCHNCGVSLSLGNFIQKIDPVLYKAYRLEKFQQSGRKRQTDTKKIEKVVSAKPMFKSNNLKDLVPLTELNNSHPAVEYILNRRLPLDSLYYTDNFKKWVNSVKPEAFPDTKQDEPRIIIPFIDKEGVVFGFQGRSLNNNGLRYITILLKEEAPKIFGLNRVNYEDTIFIVEGPFDSLLLDNAVAMAGSDLSNYRGLLGDNIVHILDNEPRNKEIVKRISRLIDMGERVVIWPPGINEKDINDMIIAGHDVRDVIKSNVYNGLEAKLKFQTWRK